LSSRFIMLKDFGVKANVRTIRKKTKVAKEGAEGATVLANGIAGGKYKGLVENLGIFESSGTIFDYLTLGDDVKEKIMEFFTKQA